jgi:hypothetical protein
MARCHERVRIGQSLVSGLGLFATREFRRGQVICEYTGRLVPSGTVANKYVFIINSRWDLDGSPRSNIGRYSNHTCGRGTAYAVVSQRRRVWLKADRRVAIGEEILWNYGREYVAGFLRGRCRCPRCTARIH